MANADNKTKANDASVAGFIAGLGDARRQQEAMAIDAIMQRVTGEQPILWGPSIIGYGSYHYRYDSGREGVSCRAGFSPRKAALTLYLIGDFAGHQDTADALFAQLGQHKTGKSCLYIKRLTDVDMAVLEQLVALNWQAMNARYPPV